MLVFGFAVIVPYIGNVSKIASSGSRSIALQRNQFETVLAFGRFVCVAITESTLPISEEG